MKIAVSNLKGGVGKTTVTQNLAVCFASMGYKVCIVDSATSQSSLAWFGVRDSGLKSLTVVGATDVKALNKTIDALYREYDIILIDGTPSLGEMTTRIILAADLLIIPILPSGHDFRSIEKLFVRYELATETAGKQIPVYFLLNRYSENVRVHSGMKELLEEHGVPVLKTTLRERVAYVATGIEGTGVLEYNDPKAIEEVVALTKEIIGIAATPLPTEQPRQEHAKHMGRPPTRIDATVRISVDMPKPLFKRVKKKLVDMEITMIEYMNQLVQKDMEG